MRGKVSSRYVTATFARITPAYAGKRYMVDLGDSRFQDHPRLCGEKLHGKQIAVYGMGSPPPMRGKGSCIPRVQAVGRITPAYAGKSGFRIPRIADSKGSPPPMRGKVFPARCIVHGHRITPAYAGKSLGMVPDDQRRWDHPRLCGEKTA